MRTCTCGKELLPTQARYCSKECRLAGLRKSKPAENVVAVQDSAEIVDLGEYEPPVVLENPFAPGRQEVYGDDGMVYSGKIVDAAGEPVKSRDWRRSAAAEQVGIGMEDRTTLLDVSTRADELVEASRAGYVAGIEFAVNQLQGCSARCDKCLGWLITEIKRVKAGAPCQKHGLCCA